MLLPTKTHVVGFLKTHKCYFSPLSTCPSIWRFQPEHPKIMGSSFDRHEGRDVAVVGPLKVCFFLFFSIQHVLVSPIVYKWCYGMSIVYRHIIIIYGFNFTHPTVYPLQTPGNLDIIWLSFLYLFECPWLPQSAGCLFLSQDAQSALDQIASGVHVLRTRLTGCPQQATGLTAVRIYT